MPSEAPANHRDAEVLRVCENLARAEVEVHTFTFMTTVHPTKGSPWAVDLPYECDGYNWRCKGCGRYGFMPHDSPREPGYRKLHEALDGAQEHATGCTFKQPPGAK